MNNITDPKYPIYKIFASWIQDTSDGKTEHNGSSGSKMFKEHPNPFELSAMLNKYWHDTLNHKSKFTGYRIIEKNPREISLKIEFSEYETWCITWFAHFTLDIGQTNQELQTSFQRFIHRKLPLVHDGKYCLMGAEEGWRHKICTCDSCKKVGIRTITH